MVLLDVYGADGSLFVNGQPLSIKGVNWFGSESYGGPPGGLTGHTIDFYLDFLQEHRFNAPSDESDDDDDDVVRRNCTLNVAAPPPRRPAPSGGGKLGKLGLSFGGKGPKEAKAKPVKEEKEEVELD